MAEIDKKTKAEQEMTDSEKDAALLTGSTIGPINQDAQHTPSPEGERDELPAGVFVTMHPVNGGTPVFGGAPKTPVLSEADLVKRRDAIVEKYSKEQLLTFAEKGGVAVDSPDKKNKSQIADILVQNGVEVDDSILNS